MICIFWRWIGSSVRAAPFCRLEIRMIPLVWLSWLEALDAVPVSVGCQTNEDVSGWAVDRYRKTELQNK
jgi:hypothetical protein